MKSWRGWGSTVSVLNTKCASVFYQSQFQQRPSHHHNINSQPQRWNLLICIMYAFKGLSYATREKTMDANTRKSSCLYTVLISYFPANQSNTQERPSDDAMLTSTIYLILGKPVSKLTRAGAPHVDQVGQRRCLP